MANHYDDQNVFAKILRGEIPCDKIYEDDYVLAFNDIAPHRKVHVIIIPKSAYMDMTDFSQNASESEIVGLNRAVAKIVDQLGLADDGYRLITNIKQHGGQEVFHLHWHLLGGEPVGPLTSK